MNFEMLQDLTNAYGRATRRATSIYRPAFSAAYAVGQCVKIASQDLQTSGDAGTVIPTTIVASNKGIQGLVCEDWRGFDGSLGTAAAVTGTLTAYGVNGRGSETVKVSTWGYHPSALIDNTGGVAITNEVLLSNATSANGAGKLMGVTAAVTNISAIVGSALLPAAGIGSTLGAGALVQATQTFTIAGVPTTGDVYTTTVSVPYVGTPSNLPNPAGVAQTQSFVSTPLTAAQAASVTTAATAQAAYLNAQAAFAKYYIATSALGVVTVTVVANPFFVTFANGGYIYITTSGTVGNSLTSSASATGVSTYAAGGATFAGGVGYVGTAPVYLEIAK